MARFISRWEPIRDLMSLQTEMSRLLDAMQPGDLPNGDGTWAPVLDLAEQDDSFLIEVDLPGVRPDDVEVTLDQNLLTVRGERRTSSILTKENVRRSERRYGSFLRTISLPSHVDADGIQADFEDGVLHITVPKAEQAKPRKIKVGTARRQLEA